MVKKPLCGYHSKLGAPLKKGFSVLLEDISVYLLGTYKKLLGQLKANNVVIPYLMCLGRIPLAILMLLFYYSTLFYRRYGNFSALSWS